ncbi:protein MAIN-LIKE 2 [Spinacia oleracea]|uniref:Protein MAIN-LIKE 2 n=1 Tax=Spinacia oleracea TaxID=3562 RepID=A0A9R0JY92_SPIOL|nr:protein MAIN-LIKE 2-like [Spinacia oleracea]
MEVTGVVKVVGRLDTIALVRESLRKDSQTFLDHCLGLGGLFRVLSLEKHSILSHFVSKVLSYYNHTSNTFDINGHKLGITLQDVLFLAKLRIDGKPVLIQEYSSKHSATVFVDEEISDVSAAKLYKIIYNTEIEWKKRKMALLMLIARCFIMPSTDGLSMYSPFFEVLSDPDTTSATYAWGAAMLAFLQHHLEKWGQCKENKLAGNVWLLVCFFLVRIPKLWDCLGLESVRGELEARPLDEHELPMRWIIEKVATKSMDRRGSYVKKMHELFESLEDEDICWTPYASWLLPDELKQDKPFVTRLGPIFCNNFVVHHKPHIVAKQFGQVDVNLEGHKLSFFDHRIRFVNNRGSHGHNYTESYKIELLMWNQKLCFLEDESEIEENEGDRIPRRGNRCLIVEPLV